MTDLPTGTTATYASPDATTSRRRPRRGVVAAYATMALLGAAFFLISFDYDLTRGGTVGPGVLPRAASALLAVLSIGLVVQEVVRGSQLSGDSGMDESQQGMTRATAIKLVAVLGLMAVAVLLVPLLGLLVPLVLLVPTLMIGVERMPVVPSIAISVGAAVVAYALFIVVLRLPIPMGVFEGIL